MSFLEEIKQKLNKDIHLKEFLRGSFNAFILRVLGIAVGYIFILIITRYYGSKAMGIYAIFTTILQIVSTIGKFGMDTAILKLVAEYSIKDKWDIVIEIYRKIIKLVLPFSLILSILIFFLSPYIAQHIFNKPDLYKCFQIASIGIIPLVLIHIHVEGIRGLKKIKEYMFLHSIGILMLASFILGLITVLLRTNFIDLKNINYIPLFVYIFSLFIICLMSYFIWIKSLPKKFNLGNKAEKFSYSSILDIAIPMFFSGSLALIIGWTDTIMLGIFRTEEEVGIYNVVLRLSILTSIVLVSASIVLAPKFVEFWSRKDIYGLVKLAQQSTKLIFLFSFPMLILFLFFPKEILGIFFGNEFKTGATALRILIIAQSVNIASGSVEIFLNMTGHQKFYQKVIFIGTIINIVLNFLLIPHFGILGAAIASAVSMIFWNFIFSLKIKQILKTWIFFPGILFK